MTSIRLADSADAPALAHLHVRSWQAAYRHILTRDYLDSLDVGRRTDHWRRVLEEGARVLVAELDGLVGFCHAGESNDEGWGEVYSIYLLPEVWGRGHGHDLMEAGLGRLRDAGFDQALLWVLEGNDRARRFYERQGWVLAKRFQILEIGGTPVTEVRYEIEL